MDTVKNVATLIALALLLGAMAAGVTGLVVDAWMMVQILIRKVKDSDDSC